MLKFDDLQQWLLGTPFGRKVLSHEVELYHNSVRNIFGYYSLQIGMPEINFLAGNKILSKFIIHHDISCDIRFMPFASNSIDLIVCPHTLEITTHYHHFLQECYRVLIPNGKIIITGFNPKSLLATFGKSAILKQINYINIGTLQQQLNTLNFQICSGKFFNYLPPLNNDSHLSNFAFLDKIGDRWFPTFANCYIIIAAKELITPTNIQPKYPFAFGGNTLAPNLELSHKITQFNREHK